VKAYNQPKLLCGVSPGNGAIEQGGDKGSSGEESQSCWERGGLGKGLGKERRGRERRLLQNRPGMYRGDQRKKRVGGKNESIPRILQQAREKAQQSYKRTKTGGTGHCAAYEVGGLRGAGRLGGPKTNGLERTRKGFSGGLKKKNLEGKGMKEAEKKGTRVVPGGDKKKH